MKRIRIGKKLAYYDAIKRAATEHNITHLRLARRVLPKKPKSRQES